MDNWKEELESLVHWDADYEELESFIEKAIIEAKIEVLKSVVKEDETGKFVLQIDFFEVLTELEQLKKQA